MAAPPPLGEPSLDLVDAADALFEAFFPLLDRDGSGFAAEADVLGALRCSVPTDEQARHELSRVTASGHVDPPRLRELIENQLKPRPGETGASWHERLVKLVITMVRDFERRAIEHNEFVAAAEAREVARHMREMEQRRAFATLEAVKKEQHDGLRRGQVKEAREFNKGWTVRMAEFNQHARRAVGELRQRHEKTLEEFLETQRPLVLKQLERTHRTSETLDAERMTARLTAEMNFDEAAKYAKRVGELRKRDGKEAEAIV